MRIEINRDECPNAPAELSDCMRCVERFINYPVQYERHCFRVVESGNFDDVTIQIRASTSRTVTDTAHEAERA